MPVTIPAIYAALLTALYIALSLRVALYRGAKGISLGDGGDRQMLLRMRAQGNCGEYVPIGIVMLLVAALQGAGAVWLHLAGLCLLVGRLMHAAHFSTFPDRVALRAGGMILTLTGIGLAAILSVI